MSEPDPEEQLRVELTSLTKRVSVRLSEAQGVLQTVTDPAASKWGIHSYNHTALSDRISAFEIEAATYREILRPLMTRSASEDHEEHLKTVYAKARSKVEDFERTVKAMVAARASLRIKAPNTL